MELLLSRARTRGTGTRDDDDDDEELSSSPSPSSSAASLSTACAEGKVNPGGFLRSTAFHDVPACCGVWGVEGERRLRKTGEKKPI